MRVKRDRIGVLWVSLFFISGFLGVAQEIQLTADADPGAESAKLQNILRGLIHSESGAASEPPSPSPRFFGLRQLSDIEGLLALKARGDRVQVVIELAPQADSFPVTDQIIHSGGNVELADGNWVQAVVSVSELNRLAEMPEVQFVRLPVRPFFSQSSIRSEGLPAVGSETWNQGGLTGQGVKVALLDGGFRGYESLLGRELPPREQVITRSFRADRQLYDAAEARVYQIHGTATAEIVHDIAPGAEVYLTAFSTDVEFRSAINWLIEQKVDVVNTSLGFPSGCFRKGGGIFESQFLKAHESGITWATAAGNEGDIHWEGAWRDTDGDDLHNYTDTDEGNTIDVELVEYQYPDGRRVATSIINALFSWDAPCTGASDDYEVVVLHEEDGRLTSLSPWNGEVGQLSDFVWKSDIPIKQVVASEDFNVSRVGQVEKYHLAIRKKKAGAADSRFEMRIDCPCRQIEYLVPQGSVGITEPSISLNVITVGAVHHSSRCSLSLCPDGKLLVYSSQGPTKDGRIKPDVTAPSHVSTSSYGRWTGEGSGRNPGFTGTSSASPHVAGAAALVKQAFPNDTPEQIKQFLEGRAEDAGEPGKDSRYGSGILSLGQPPGQLPTIAGIEPTSVLPGSTIQASIGGTNLLEATAITFSGSGVTAVLQAGGTATTLPITITVAADASPGARTFIITALAGTASSGQVTFTVLQYPRIGVEPAGLSFQATVGEQDPPAQTLRIAGSGTLSWQASVDVPWLSLSATTGTAPTEISVSTEIAQLVAGTYQGQITITAPDAINSPLTVPVTLTLEAPPGDLIALLFKQLEFVVPGDWERALREGCVVYTNLSGELSTVRVTLSDDSVKEFEIPAGNEVIVCGDVVHIDTRPRTSSS
ncbi:MAG: hypothetical protein A2Z21_02325 [Candidatus Fraserbacteria bacterium RBG_16_55_9]|uniref:Peptidase S8/S53 domain-containing protein n=1 Tax=Fraserbacteria sp. (strain RBG_16_55_9) TaxID=1817864 RepID=A0A1F5V1Q5_FRAXR|nr:MAG: hypothetical protein A2Z21_02325 [Candidatus Fraserbacteria bacterium RBG_16_55_9]